jgi:hypothetical protein
MGEAKTGSPKFDILEVTDAILDFIDIASEDIYW